jgi:hypothetical protein
MSDRDYSTWTRYYDENQSAYYLYNATTDESVWEEDVESGVEMTVIDGSLKDSLDVEADHLLDEAIHTSDHVEEVKHRSKTFRAKDYPRNGKPMTVQESNSYDIACYHRFVFVHAIFVEAPLCIVEGFIRCVLVFCVAVFSVFYFLFTNRIRLLAPLLCAYIREIFLVLASIVTLAVPGSICIAYRNYSNEVPWELQPLPTVLGMVDMRRYGAVTFGMAGWGASNSRLARIDNSSSSSSSVTSCQDGWRGEERQQLLWPPRDVFHDIKQFLQGQTNSVESLGIVL